MNISKKNIKQDTRIHECDYGLLSGSAPGDKIFEENKKMWDVYDKKYKDPVENMIQENKQIEKMKKKYGYENYSDRIKRAKSFFKSLPKNVKNIIIVTHGNMIQISLSLLFNITPGNSILGDLKNGKNCTISCVIKKRVSINY